MCSHLSREPSHRYVWDVLCTFVGTVYYGRVYISHSVGVRPRYWDDLLKVIDSAYCSDIFQKQNYVASIAGVRRKGAPWWAPPDVKHCVSLNYLIEWVSCKLIKVSTQLASERCWSYFSCCDHISTHSRLTSLSDQDIARVCTANIAKALCWPERSVQGNNQTGKGPSIVLNPAI